MSKTALKVEEAKPEEILQETVKTPEEEFVTCFIPYKPFMDCETVVTPEGKQKMLSISVNGKNIQVPCDTTIEIPKAFYELVRSYTTVA